MTDSRSPVRLSVLDRLLEPGATAGMDRQASVDRLRQGVRRDLESLLNSHAPLWRLPEECPETATSVLNYGLPDYTGVGESMEFRRTAISRQIARLIDVHEPRLTRVRVDVRRDEAGDKWALRLRVEAVLKADPVIEPIVFDSILRPAGTGIELTVEADG
ncbi:MAG: type VI secretion system baseplate subunit TssE [Alphaproteobacteria bacterium]|nr:type VI secretion system baseplate subunit TssE [Alphaproteobacteria bacterium]